MTQKMTAWGSQIIITSPYFRGAVVIALTCVFKLDLEPYKSSLYTWAEGGTDEFPLELKPFLLGAHHQLVF
jgi:hypothetical protein